MVKPSPYCTIGPFFPTQFVDDWSDLTQFDGKIARGQHIILTGRVAEEGNLPAGNVIVEIWQPDAGGVFRNPLDVRLAQADPGFFGWGRARTDAQGCYRFRTVLPGRSDSRAPHINVMVLAIGLTRRLVTTVFFFDGSDCTEDPVLTCVADKAARARLFALRDPALDGDGLPAYRFDIVLRGVDETPFFLD